jgi:hypothetical protein
MDLKLFIESRNFDQKEFANSLGISPGAISNYIAGTRKPSLEIGRMIETYTKGKVTIDDLLSYYHRHNKNDSVRNPKHSCPVDSGENI